MLRVLPVAVMLSLLLPGLISCEKNRRVFQDSNRRFLSGGELLLSEDFERGLDRWSNASGNWRIEKGRLFSGDKAEENQGLWLKEALLPANVRVEFDAESVKGNNKVFQGDMKFEFGGDKPQHLSGYIVIFGGWKNSLSTIAKNEEHTGRLVIDTAKKVVEGKKYHVAFVRYGKELRWYLDGELFMQVKDKDVLGGGVFGFNNWDSRFFVDNLKIFKLR